MKDHYDGLVARLIWDGTDEVRIPEELGKPNPGQMEGTALERLGELCGRTCYDSLGAEKARSSLDYHPHIRQVRHTSVYGGCVFTLEVPISQVIAVNPMAVVAIFKALMNRPGVWLNTANPDFLRVTTNLRSTTEWAKWTARNWRYYDGLTKQAAEVMGTVLHRGSRKLAPQIAVDVIDSGLQYWGVRDNSRVVEPEDDSERWISVYMEGSRGFCYDDQTEVLTDEGWKPWPTVRGTELFASMTPAGELVYEKSSRLTIENHDGPMYSVHSEQVDLCVTPNHRMWVQKVDTQAAKRGEEQFGIVEAKELLNKRVRYQKGGTTWRGKRHDYIEIPSTTRSVNGGVKEYPGAIFPAEAFAKFLGFYISEGCLESQNDGDGMTAINITQNTGEVFDEIMETLDEMDAKATVTNNGLHGTNKRISFKNLALRDWLSEHCLNGAPNKRVPSIVGEWSVDLIETFLDALVKGDGNVHENGHVVLYTTSRQLADDAQVLAMKAGRAANIRIDDRVGESHVMPSGQILTHREVCYIVSFLSKSRLYPHVNNNRCSLKTGSDRTKFDRDDRGNCDEFVGYTGKVYCVTVPSGLLYVRRNGKPVWSGNSHELVRHGFQTGISQRSTRYVDEDGSPWVMHPLIQELLIDEARDPEERAMVRGVIAEAEAAGRKAYATLVKCLQPFARSRIKDDPYAASTARKQARGASRGYLGNALKTAVIFSASVDEWLWMLSQRAADAADGEIRCEFAQEVLPELKKSRYASSFANLETQPAVDGVGLALRGGGNK